MDFLVGEEGIIPPIVDKFLRNNPPPKAWGENEKDRWKNAYFMGNLASNPSILDTLTVTVSFHEIGKWPLVFFDLFQSAPDFALKLMIHVRKKMKIGGDSSNLTSAKAYLREGAMDRFKKKHKGREPTDDELSAMIEEEFGDDFTGEVFGDARRAMIKEDREVSEKLKKRLSQL